MNTKPDIPVRERWARLRFAIIGPLLAAPPQRGELQTALKALALKTWRHPVTGAPKRFDVSTIERWYYAEYNFMRSQFFPIAISFIKTTA